MHLVILADFIMLAISKQTSGVVVQWLDFSPIMREPSVRFHTGEKSDATICCGNVVLPVDMS